MAQENNYIVEVSDNGSTGWAQLAELAAGTTSYQHTGLAASTTKHYRVKAKGNGTTTSDSAYSSVATATTDAATGAGAKLNSPILNSVVEQAGNLMTVTWTDTNNTPPEYGIEIEVDSVPTFDSGTAAYGLFETGANDVTETVPAQTDAYNLYARVRAKGDGVNTLTSEWSNVLPHTAPVPAVWGNFNGSTSKLTGAGNFDLNQDFELDFLFLLAGTNTPGLVTNQTATEFTNKQGLLSYHNYATNEVILSVYSDAAATITIKVLLPNTSAVWREGKIQRAGTKLYLVVDGIVSSATVGTLVNSTSNQIRYGVWHSEGTNRTLNGKMANLRASGAITYEIPDPSTGTDTSGNGNNFTPTAITQGT